ncbi:orcokinin peptides type B-like [Tigriopus californicus]|nr:orcokinin peptides type B-like [Tigriopus californicus]
MPRPSRAFHPVGKSMMSNAATRSSSVLFLLLVLPSLALSASIENGRRPPSSMVRSLDPLGGGNMFRSLDSLGGGHLIRALDPLGGGHMLRQLDPLGGGHLIRGFNQYPDTRGKRGFDPMSGMTFGMDKRFDEMDRHGFGEFVKKNFDEIDSSGFGRFVKKNFDEMDRAGFGSFVKRPMMNN